jgi:hypothetical protein
MNIWKKVYRFLFLEEGIGELEKPLPRFFNKKPKVKYYYKSQLDYLVELLSAQLSDAVTYTYESDKRAAMIELEGEMVARISIFPKGETEDTTYVVVRTDVLQGAMAWFQLAFVSMKVRHASLKPVGASN